MLKRKAHTIQRSLFIAALSLGLMPGLSTFPGIVPLPSARAATSNEAVRVVILPFENISQNPEDNWLSRSFSESLTMGLLQVEQLQLIERAQLQNVMKEQHFGQSVYADESSAPKLGKLVGAKWVVLGSFQKVGERLQANVRVVDAETGKIERARAAQVEGEWAQIFQLQKQLAHQLVHQLAIQTKDTNMQDMDKVIESTNSVQAYRYYMEGKEALHFPDDHKQAEAIRAFQKALVEDPEYALAYVGLAEAYAMKVQKRSHMLVPPPSNPNLKVYAVTRDPLEQAREYADKALALNPNSPDVWRILAVLEDAEGHPQRAMELVEKAIALDPDNGTAVLTWVDLRQRQSKTSFSIDVIRSELGKMGAKINDPWLKFYLASNGFALEALRPNAELGWVKKLINEAAEALPDYPFIPIIQSGLAMTEQNPQQARSYLERAYTLGKEYPQVLLAVAEMFANLKDYEKALSAIAQAEKLGGNADDVLLTRADVLFSQGKRSEAEPLYADLMARNPESVTIYFTHGLHYFTTDKPSDWSVAAHSLQRALDNHDSYGSVLNRTMIASLLAAAYFVTQDYTASQKLYEELRTDPLYYGVAYQRLADIYQKQNRLEEAFAAYQNYLAIHSQVQEQAEVKQRYRELYLLNERAQKGDSGAILNDLAQIYILQQRWDEAQALLLKAIQLDAQNPVLHFNLGLLFQQQAQFKEATKHLELAVAYKPDYVKAWYSLGLAHKALGNLDDAAVALRRVLELEPQHENARAALLKLRGID